MLYNLCYHTQNVNSLVRASTTESNLTIPILDYLLKTNCIETLGDTRMNDLKLKKIKKDTAAQYEGLTIEQIRQIKKEKRSRREWNKFKDKLHKERVEVANQF